ncbi:MAG TPA: tetratricopeptide repeat protein [Bryobacteraceae bacterium]|jgi:general secretion pathway protein D|nr:tetratricopeptide repeat protein [Bryobacteraceae bacterium]
MIPSNKLRAIVPLCVVLLFVPAGGLEATNRKGDKLFKLGVQAEARKEYDKALEYFQQALDIDPKETTYELAARRTRFEAGQAHVEAGKKLLQANDLDKAYAEFQKAFATDPGSMIALQDMQQTKELLDQKQKGLLPPGEKPLTSAQKAQKESLEMIQSLQSVPELKPVTNQISLLKMNNQPPKVLYETVGKLAGINVLFDPTMQAGKNANLDLNNVTLQEALDYTALLTKTYWKPVSGNAIFVTEDNVTKRRDYEDEVVKVFYLKNPTSTQEFNEMVTAVRSVTDVRRMFQFNGENAVVVRDTVDKVMLVEKLLHDLDKPKAEVVIDVIVMDVASDVSHNIGAGLVSNGTNGLSVPFAFSPTNPITSTSTGASGTGGTGATSTTTTTTPTTGTTGSSSSFIALSQLGHLSTNDFSTSLPGAMLQAVMSDSRTKIQESPEVRVSDGQKVDLKIGEKYPYATGSFQPGVGTVGVSPLVSTQFQFVDIGVNVTITPHVHGDDEVTLHVAVDISNIANTLNLGGLSQPVIGQKKSEADIRLKDGEVSLLGGLMSDQDTSVISGIPGLVNIPVLGKYLFGNTTKDKQKEQLMIALIPHIVRKPDITGLDMRGIAAGTDATVKLSYAPRVPEAAAAAPAPAAGAPAAPGATTPAVTPATPGGAAGLVFNPGRVQAPLSSQVKIALEAQNMADLASVPVKVRWDPKVLRLEMITPGALLTQDGKIVSPSLDIRNDTGDASIDVNRIAGAGGVSGTGALLQLTFTAVGKGTTTVSVTEAPLKNAGQQPIVVQAPSVSVTVQ